VVRSRSAHATIAFVRDALARGEQVEIRCSGSSMTPTLRDQDRVDVAADTAPALGDVVLIEDGDKLILHRLLARFEAAGRGPWIAHRGDQHWRTVGLAPASAILGVARMRREEPSEVARWATVAFAFGRWAAVAAFWRLRSP
jgi:hypothetical protein